MASFKVTMLIDDCETAAEAKIWAREAPGPVLKVAKMRRVEPRSHYCISVDGKVNKHPYLYKTQAIACVRLLRKRNRADKVKIKYEAIQVENR